MHFCFLQSGTKIARVLAALNVFSDTDPTMIRKQFSDSMPIKKLLMVVEMAQQGEDGTLVKQFFQCMADYGIGSGASFSIKGK